MLQKISLLFLLVICLQAQDLRQLSGGNTDEIEIIIGTFLGDEQRNYYGNHAPGALDVIWKHYLGKGKTIISKRIGERIWSGSGWTGQPLLVREDEDLFLIQGALDHNLKKINARTGKLVWQYKYDDVIKGTGSIWRDRNAKNLEESVIILQGSRRGYEKDLSSKIVPSFRAISYFSGKELWRMNVRRTSSYSRDVDASAIVLGDTAYIGLENALFTVFSPRKTNASLRSGIFQPQIYQEIPLYEKRDVYRHGGNLVVESSPALLGKRLYLTCGSGHVYGYHLTKRKIDWEFYTGSDMDGSPVVTADSALLVSIEKQYIKGRGGVFKIHPDKGVQWYFPTENDSVETWEGGVIGSPCTNDRTRRPGDPHLAAFIGIDGYLYVVDHMKIDSDSAHVDGPNLRYTYPRPKLVYRKKVGPSIATPVIIGNKVIVPGYAGLFLFTFDSRLNFKLLDKIGGYSFESTAIVNNGKIYIGSRNGYLYCLGEQNGKKEK